MTGLRYWLAARGATPSAFEPDQPDSRRKPFFAPGGKGPKLPYAVTVALVVQCGRAPVAQFRAEAEMRSKVRIAAALALSAGLGAHAVAQRARGAAPQPQMDAAADPVKVLVDRLDLERYKAAIKGLTAFGDRRQGTDRNRAAIDWIEAQLKSYGCANTERLKYDYQPAPAAAGPAAAVG